MIKLKTFFTKTFLENGRDLLTRRQSGIFSAALVISLTYGVSMILGILRERLLVANFYACCSSQLDVYYAAFRLPDMIFQLVVIGALSAAFIPVFSESLTSDEKSAYRLASSLINILMTFFIVLAAIVFIFAKPISTLITGNFSASQINLMTQMTRVMLFAQILFLVSNFFSAMIQSNQRFLLPSLSPVVYNLGIILSVVFLSRFFGIWAATIGVLVGAFFHLLIQLPLLLKLGFKYSFSFDFSDHGVKKVIKLMLPRTLALAASQIEATVSLFLATSLAPGSLTIYYLAHRLVDLPVRLLGTSVGQAALPILSLQLAQKQEEEFKTTLRRSFDQILYLSFPATAIFLVLRVQLVRFAYGAKSFPWIATIMTSRTLAAVAFSIFSQSASQLLVRGFYALHDTKTPFIVSLISVAVSVVLSLILIFSLNLGIFGLALAFSIANVFNLIALLLVFNFRKEKFVNNNNLFSWLKMIIASLIAGFFSWGSMRILDNFVFDTTKSLPLLLLTLISLGVGLLVYLFISRLFKFKELSMVLNLGKKFSHWKETLFSVEEIIEPQSANSGS
ncbi:murein biosynthesis integral membrane protein MurJ [Candidatus Shapirobacteria bacterium CG09_land_8_20_14_0_10_39_12]|uniref:Probable lipid II flippase MurJ n=1 Tax=Candidatus Shapirobacteria bacterium CG09_land_8_20_14_0_10_39_12 TaxID=1974885 RepID=A0A2H0WQ34_9BACT|nr:MAG: murein biosynthesis integral membrane protein MurJ [Candidatus Shapirobacteria bacterium CG09_land_8_20_14_0_10_39_12]